MAQMSVPDPAYCCADLHFSSQGYLQAEEMNHTVRSSIAVR